MYLTWLADEFRAAGLDVYEDPGWQTRGRGQTTGMKEQFKIVPLAVAVHHTASSAPFMTQVRQMIDTSSIRPVCQVTIGPTGLVGVLAAGTANTSGRGRAMTFSRGTVATDTANTRTVGFEMQNNGVGQPWPQVQIDAMFTAILVVNRRLGNKPDDAFTHNWYTLVDPSNPNGSARKIDPARASAVQGPWRPRGLSNGADTWNNADLLAELRRRAQPTPPPQPPEDDDMPLFVVKNSNNPTGYHFGDRTTRRYITSQDVASSIIGRGNVVDWHTKKEITSVSQVTARPPAEWADGLGVPIEDTLAGHTATLANHTARLQRIEDKPSGGGGNVSGTFVGTVT